MNDQRKVVSLFRKRWFWILMLMCAVAGIALALLFPVTNRSPF
jgi:hypothetical protein